MIKNFFKKDLFDSSAKIYMFITGIDDVVADTVFGNKIIDAYFDLLEKDEVNFDKLYNFISKNSFFCDVLNKKRTESVLYREPVVIILAWLVFNNSITVPKRWPEDLNYLEDFYISVGISTQGLF